MFHTPTPFPLHPLFLLHCRLPKTHYQLLLQTKQNLMTEDPQLNITHAFIICGNDGTGKTSTASLLNSHFSSHHLPYHAFQRSTTPSHPTLLSLKNLLSPKQIDTTTFLYPFQPRPALPQKVSYMGRQIAVTWIMLDAELQTIEKRIRNRTELSIYQIRKCLEYYKAVYREMAVWYGIQVFATDGRSQEEVVRGIVEGIEKGKGEGVRRLGLERLEVEEVESGQEFGVVGEKEGCKVYELKNQYYSEFEVLVLSPESTKVLMLNRQVLHRNNISDNIVCVSPRGIVLRYKQSTQRVGTQIRVLAKLQGKSETRVSVLFYEDGLKYPLDKDSLGDLSIAQESTRFALRVLCSFKYYSSKAQFDVSRLFVKSTNNTLNNFIREEDIQFGEVDPLLVYQRIEQYLLANRFHLTQLLEYSVYPYQKIASSLSQSLIIHKSTLRGFTNETLDLPISYYADASSNNSWISSIVLHPQHSLEYKQAGKSSTRTPIIDYQTYSQQKKEQYKNHQQLIVHLEVDHKLQSLDGGNKKSIVEILNTLVGQWVDTLSLRVTSEQPKAEEVLKELMIQMPRRIKNIFFRNEVKSLEDLRFLWGLGRIIPNISLLNPVDVIKDVLNFDSKGNTLAKISSLQDMITLSQQQVEDLLTHQQISIGKSHYKIKQLFFHDNNTRLYLVVDNLNRKKQLPNTVTVGISAGKYYLPIDKFIEDQLGIRLVRQLKPRQMLVECEIVDREKYQRYFGNKQVSFILMKSKDLPSHLEKGVIDACISYSPILENSITSAVPVVSVVYPEISVGLIQRDHDMVDPSLWTPESPTRIATEHPNYTRQYFNSQGIRSDTYELYEVSGCSQSYLVGNTQSKFTLCDAVIETGSTMKLNNLTLWQTTKQKGQITIALYQL